MTKTIDKFDGTEHAFLSNFFPSPFIYEGIKWPTVEHAYQAMKTLDLQSHLIISRIRTPGQAKKAGRALNHLRDDWEEVKEPFMLTFIRLKFKIPELRVKFILTVDAILIEGNTWGDRYWGQVNGVGKNRLGHLLMQHRSELTEF